MSDKRTVVVIGGHQAIRKILIDNLLSMKVVVANPCSRPEPIELTCSPFDPYEYRQPKLLKRDSQPRDQYCAPQFKCGKGKRNPKWKR